MILKEEQIKDYILSPKNSAEIVAGDRIQREHKVHVTGEGYIDALIGIIGKERAVDYGNRELKEPATKFLTKKIRDELSRWKNNQGTRKTYDFGDDEKLAIKFRSQLQSVWKNGSVQDFSYFLNDALYTDFGGFAMVERGRKDGNLEIRDGIPTKYSGIPYIVFVALSDVHDFLLRGRKVEYLILRFEDKYFRVIDDEKDAIYEIRRDDKGNAKEVRRAEGFELIKNELEYVPAIQIGDVLQTPLNDQVKTSHIFQTLPLLQDYMTRHAEHVMSELLHASPLLAIKGTKCQYEDENGNKCAGGTIWSGDEEVKCPNCGGVGATVPKNSSEIIIVPELDKQGNTYNPSMIGQYITPPTEVLDHQAKELDTLENRTIFSGTGIRTLVKTSIQTATEVILNVKPLEDKISALLDNIEAVETFVTDAIGKLVYKSKYSGCFIRYGRRLNVRDENLILDEIEQSKRSALPVSEIRLLYEELYMTRYRNSPSELERALMMLKLEPLAVYSTAEVLASENVTDSDKWFKQNFDDYIDMFENEFGAIQLYQTDKDMNVRIRIIRKKLEKYNEKRKGTKEGEGAGAETDDDS